MELFAIRAACCPRFFVSLGSPGWVKATTNLLLPIPSPPVFAYYSGLVLDDGHSWLINVIAHSEFAVCASMFFLQAADKSLTDIFKSDKRLAPGALYLVAILALVIDLVDTGASA